MKNIKIIIYGLLCTYGHFGSIIATQPKTVWQEMEASQSAPDSPSQSAPGTPYPSVFSSLNRLPSSSESLQSNASIEERLSLMEEGLKHIPETIESTGKDMVDKMYKTGAPLKSTLENMGIMIAKMSKLITKTQDMLLETQETAKETHETARETQKTAKETHETAREMRISQKNQRRIARVMAALSLPMAAYTAYQTFFPKIEQNNPESW